MIGGSYGGQIQFAIAGIDRRLDTIVPQITWNDLSYSLGPNNTDFSRGITYRTPGVIKLDWPVLFSALGVGQGFQQAVQNQDPSHLGACPNFTDQVCRSLVTSSRSTGYPDDATLALLRHASVASYMSRIRIPTLPRPGPERHALRPAGGRRHLQGAARAGHAGEDALALVRALRRRHRRREQRHEPETAYESRMELEWFDHYLRGIGARRRSTSRSCATG